MGAKPIRKFMQMILMLAAFSVLAGGCLISPGSDFTIKKISQLKPNQVLLVGKVELIPKLRKGEQINVEGAGKWTTRSISFEYNKKWKPVSGPTSYRKPLHASDALKALANRDTTAANSLVWLRETFFAPLEKGNYYIVQAALTKEVVPGTPGYGGGYGGGGAPSSGGTSGYQIIAYLPGGLKLTMRPSDKAVYVGTIRYYRDKNFDVHKIRIVDEYKKTLKEYKKRFPNKPPPLKKRLLKKVKGYKLKY